MMGLDILALLMGCASAAIFILSELHSKKVRAESRAALESSQHEGGDGHDS